MISQDHVQRILIAGALVAGASATTLMLCAVWLLELLEPPITADEARIEAVETIRVIERFALGGAVIAVALFVVAGGIAWRRHTMSLEGHPDWD